VFFEGALTVAQEAGLEYLAIDAAHMLGIVEQEEIAIRWNEAAIDMAEEAADDRARGWLGPLYNNLAWTYNDAGEHEQALALFEKDIRLRESLDQEFEASIARWSKAKTLRLLGRTSEALEIQQSLVEHPDRKGKSAEGYTHEEIGECLIVLGQEEAAAPHFAIAFAILKLDPWLVANESERLSRIERLSNRG
jgi:tetratricopeptide (TPR) repeat protein